MLSIENLRIDSHFQNPAEHAVSLRDFPRSNAR